MTESALSAKRHKRIVARRQLASARSHRKHHAIAVLHRTGPRTNGYTPAVAFANAMFSAFAMFERMLPKREVKL